MADEPRCVTDTIGRWCGKPANPRSKEGYCAQPNSRCRSAMRDHRQRTSAGANGVAALVQQDGGEVAREVLAEALAPAIQDAITEEVLEGLQGLVTALPLAVATAIANLESNDETIRQRAAEMIARYSAGNKQIVPDVNAGKQADLTIIFDLPRPEIVATSDEDGPINSKECDSCGVTKPLAEFVGRSDRCTECFASIQESIAKLEQATPQR